MRLQKKYRLAVEVSVQKSHYTVQNQVFLRMLKASRKARNMRQIDVGERLGRGQALVSKVESGERRMDIIELRLWLSALDVDFVSFIADLDECIRASESIRGSLFPQAQQSKEAAAVRKIGDGYSNPDKVHRRAKKSRTF